MCGQPDSLSSVRQTLSFIGAKGGTLKTASTAAVAHVLAKTGLRIVMVDLDPQADLTTRSHFSRVADPLSADPVQVRYEGEPEMPLWLLRGGRSMEAPTWTRCAVTWPGHRRSIRTWSWWTRLLRWVRDAHGGGGVHRDPIGAGEGELTRAHDVIAVATEGGRSPIIRILLTKANVHTKLYHWTVENVDTLYPKMRSPHVVPFETAAAESAIFDRR